MVIIWPCSLSPSRYAAAGKSIDLPALRCPTCLVRLMRWGGYWRWLRAPLLIERVWIRRGRCGVCGSTHALLPDLVLARRLDEVAIIVPHTTVRTWWRRFQARSATLVAHCTALAVTLDGTPFMLASSDERAALDALQVAW